LYCAYCILIGSTSVTLSQRAYKNVTLYQRAYKNFTLYQRAYKNFTLSQCAYKNVTLSQRAYKNVTLSQRAYKNVTLSQRAYKNVKTQQWTKSDSNNYLKICRSTNKRSDFEIQNFCKTDIQKHSPYSILLVLNPWTPFLH
jgi:hypothetical protein